MANLCKDCKTPVEGGIILCSSCDKRLEAAVEELLTTATTTNDDSPAYHKEKCCCGQESCESITKGIAMVFDCEEGGKKCTFSCSKSIEPLIEGDEVLIICCTCAAKKEAGAVLRTAPPSDATIIHAAEASPTPSILVTTTCTAGLCIEQFNHEGPEKFVVQTNGTSRDLQRVLIDGDSQTKMKGKGCRLFASPTFPFNVCFEYFSVEAKVMMDPKKFNQSLFANSLLSHPRKPNVIIVAVLLKKAPQFPTAIVVLDETTKKIRWIHSRELADLFVDGYTFNSVEIVSDSLRDLIASKKKEFFELEIPEAHIPSPLYDPLVSLSIPGTLKAQIGNLVFHLFQQTDMYWLTILIYSISVAKWNTAVFV